MEKLTYTHNADAAAVIAQTYDTPPLAYVRSYGCQQNVNDGEKIRGVLMDIGFGVCDSVEQADLILFNTCAVREHAEQRVFGNVGALKKLKEKNPRLIIGVCGCMAQQKHIVDKLRASYPYVDLVFGVDGIDRLPAMLVERLHRGKRYLETPAERNAVVEELPIRRDSGFRAWLPIMYGCDNFCTYCIVPYVRGRERSRGAEAICHEIEKAVALGYKEFTLLGQNVNSYGKDRGEEEGFSKLLKLVDAIPGVERIRYMTSHPRDMSEAVVRTIAESQHICKNFHIPVQSGSSRIMKAMNRGYDRERYLKLVETIRRFVPDAVITTDLIVGFPGETEKDFEDTLDLLRTVEYDDAFTFIYSPRKGTPAASFEAQVPDEVKHERLDRLMALQNEICLERNKRLVGKTLAVMVEGPSKSNPAMLSGRTDGNDLVLWPKIRDHAPGDLVNVKMERAQTWLIRGKEEA